MLRRTLRGLKRLVLAVLVVLVGVPAAWLVLWGVGVVPSPSTLIELVQSQLTGETAKKALGALAGGWVLMVLMDELLGGPSDRHDHHRDDGRV